jgi:aryl-alcohol dehydrogenase-like predicted oxidoreductase
MMARWHEALFPVLEELNVGYVAFSPLANGILTDAFRKGDKFSEADYRSVMPQYTDEAYDANQKLLELIRHYAGEKNATPAQISLAWMMSKKPYIVPIPGSRKPERITENAGAVEVVLSEQEVKRIDEQLGVMEMSGVFGGSPVKRGK